MRGKKGQWFFYGLTVLAVLMGVKAMSRSVTVMVQNREQAGRTCIVIDPGHGGEDGGAVSVSGRPESGYNLEIALRLRDLLGLLGYETKMTRETDISIYTEGETLARKKASDLKERLRIMGETPNALVLSIHQNFYPDGRYSGPQIFYPKTAGSEALAKHLQQVMSEELSPGSSRNAKKASGVYLMEHIPCTGVLIECGFLSHYGEEAALRDPAYQKKVSGLIAAGVSQYLSNT